MDMASLHRTSLTFETGLFSHHGPASVMSDWMLRLSPSTNFLSIQSEAKGAIGASHSPPQSRARTSGS